MRNFREKDKYPTREVNFGMKQKLPLNPPALAYP